MDHACFVYEAVLLLERDGLHWEVLTSREERWVNYLIHGYRV